MFAACVLLSSSCYLSVCEFRLQCSSSTRSRLLSPFALTFIDPIACSSFSLTSLSPPLSISSTSSQANTFTHTTAYIYTGTPPEASVTFSGIHANVATAPTASGSTPSLNPDISKRLCYKRYQGTKAIKPGLGSSAR